MVLFDGNSKPINRSCDPNFSRKIHNFDKWNPKIVFYGSKHTILEKLRA